MTSALASYRWDPQNQLTRARDRNRLGDANVTSGSIQPLVHPLAHALLPPAVNDIVRPMGATTIDQRRNAARRGNPRIWDGTPVEKIVTDEAVLGDPEIDLTEYFQGWSSVGWEWSKADNQLKCYMTRDGKTYTVRFPMAKIRKIFNSALGTLSKIFRFRASTISQLWTESRNLSRLVDRKPSLNGFFKSVGNFFKKTGKSIVKTATKVASSPVFGAIAGVAAAVPPLTAVGGAALAAHVAVKTAKPFIDAGVKVVEAVGKSPKSLVGAARSIAQGVLPKEANQFLGAALSTAQKALPGAKPKKKKKLTPVQLKKQTQQRIFKATGRMIPLGLL